MSAKKDVPVAPDVDGAPSTHGMYAIHTLLLIKTTPNVIGEWCFGRMEKTKQFTHITHVRHDIFTTSFEKE